MYLRYIVILNIALSFLVGPSVARPGHGFLDSLGLSEAIEYALEHNPMLKAFGAKAEAAKARISQAVMPEDPEIGINFYQVPQSTGNPFDTTEYRYSVEQKFPFLGKLIQQGKIAKKEWQIEIQEWEAKKLEIILDVQHSFHNLFLIDRELEINRENILRMQSVKKIAESHYALGNGAMTQGSVTQGLVTRSTFSDVLKASIEISRLEEEEANLTKGRIERSAEFNRLLGRGIREPVGLTHLRERGLPDFSYEDLETIAFRQNPSLRAAKLFVEKEKKAKNLAKQSVLPDFKLGFQYMQLKRDEDRLMYMAGISVPIYSFWKQAKEVKEADAKVRAARAMNEDVENEFRQMLKSSLADYDRAKKVFAIYALRALPSAKAALNAQQLGLETGQIGFLEFIDTWRSYQEMELAYWRAFEGREKALAHLEYIAGAPLVSDEIPGGSYEH